MAAKGESGKSLQSFTHSHLLSTSYERRNRGNADYGTPLRCLILHLVRDCLGNVKGSVEVHTARSFPDAVVHLCTVRWRTVSCT